MGLYLVWKAPGPSSGQALSRFKLDLGLGRGREGIGHTGTLDPFAEGLLLVGTGEATKLLTPLVGLPKTYEAEMLLGLSSDTLDLQGQLAWMPASDRAALAEACAAERSPWGGAARQEFLGAKRGDFLQRPPAFSALKVDGKRAYELARKGQEVELKLRPATILELRELAGPSAQTGSEGVLSGEGFVGWSFEVRVSSGTYIRCLARDWGQELCGHPGLLRSLVRTSIGPFAGARPPAGEGLVRSLGAADLAPLLPILELEPPEVADLLRGGLWRRPKGPETANRLLVERGHGRCVAFTDEQGALARVFRSDPFAPDRSVE